MLESREPNRTHCAVETGERFQATFEQAAVGMALVGLDDRCLQANQRLCAIVGYDHDEALRHVLPSGRQGAYEMVSQHAPGVDSRVSGGRQDETGGGRRACLASAALPFGIVPPVEMEEVEYVDGGVVDNVPFTPLIGKVDEIFVVLLQPYRNEELAARSVGLTRQRWADLLRLAELSRLPLPEPVWSASSPSRLLTLGEQSRRSPSGGPRSGSSSLPPALGGFIDGTLRFEASYARQLLERGYRETRSRLAESEFCSSPER
jgi:hypothetical protein